VKRGYGIRDYPYTADVGPWTLFSAAVDTIILTCPSLRLTTICDLPVHAASGKDAVGDIIDFFVDRGPTNLIPNTT
jgi:hypothetical protein